MEQLSGDEKLKHNILDEKSTPKIEKKLIMYTF